MNSSISSLDRFQSWRIRALWLIALAVGGLVMFSHSSWDQPLGGGPDIHDLIELVGLGLIGIAVVGRLWSTLYIGGRKNAELVMDGPYSATRNPLYFFSIIGAGGIGAQSGSLVIAALCTAIATAVFVLTARREEVFLGETFGAKFDDYRARVPLIWPRMSGFHDVETLTIRTNRLYETLRDGLFMFLAFPIFELIEYAQEAGVLKVLIALP